MEVAVTTGAVKSCKAPVKLSSPTNQHPTIYTLDDSCHTTNSVNTLSLSVLTAIFQVNLG